MIRARAGALAAPYARGVACSTEAQHPLAPGGTMDRINEVTKDCFNALFQVRQLDESSLPPPEVLHQRLLGFIDALFQ